MFVQFTPSLHKLLGFIDLLSSKVAIWVYVGVLVVSVGLLVLAIVFNEMKTPNVITKTSSTDLSNLKLEDTEKKQKKEPLNADGRPIGRFSTLIKLDENRKSFKRASYDKHVTLQNMCENFRNYAARHLKLYYSEEDIRRFVAGAAVSKIMILQGMSGTGKTSLAHAFGEFLDNPSTVISVQPMWKERTDL
ncbi:MAG: ATP-binding protein, partial [Clostridia bacterium]|nr:ATP-binding protein [Clostridia bacterium]